MCELCNREEETVGHLWFQCSYVKTVSDLVFKWAGIGTRKSSVVELLEWFAEDVPVEGKPWCSK